MKILESKEQFSEITKLKNVIAVFSADWCPDCRVIEPYYPELKEEFTDYTFVLVDRDQFIEICQAYDVFGIPSFIAFRKGEEIGRLVNKKRKTKEEIASFIRKLPKE